MKITKADHAPNFVEYCPAWRYPEGLDYPLCALYSTNGLLPGGVGLPLSAVRKYEWRNRVLCRTKYLYQGSDYDREIAARSSYTRAIIQRSRRFGSFEVTGDPGFGNAAAAGFSVWFYRTRGEAQYGARLRSLVDSFPGFSRETLAEPHLLCLGPRFPRNFRFLRHGRVGQLHE
eukprot:IDg23788t1